MQNNNKITIAIIGLGYVGFPLAVEFSKKYNVIGFDTNHNRINDLNNYFDHTGEIKLNKKSILISNTFKNESTNSLFLTHEKTYLSYSTVFIITVPTPIDQYKVPDLSPLLNATKLVAGFIKKGAIVIYESTVFPGCTEENCVPILEKYSGFIFNKDFFCGYSPERINPGDKINTLTKIIKVTSGSNKKTALFINKLYKSIITAGTYLAPSIKVAEASKAIENAQRDLNISFMNELSIIFQKIGIDTTDVLEAASTKWNFLNFKPGLVGGHCIGVDPYYLVHKAESLGYHPQVILSGRRVNDNMGNFVANSVIKLMIKNGIKIHNSKVLILGFTFKENCNDIRNTRVIDIYNELRDFGLNVDIYDPLVDLELVNKEYGIRLLMKNEIVKYESIILAVSHQEFKTINIKRLKVNASSVVFDTKSFLDRKLVNSRL
jgi:UDP-N-acetyl-D-galactosamine dehydrogenase